MSLTVIKSHKTNINKKNTDRKIRSNREQENRQAKHNWMC